MGFYKLLIDKYFYSLSTNQRFMIPKDTIILLDLTSLKQITYENIHDVRKLSIHCEYAHGSILLGSDIVNVTTVNCESGFLFLYKGKILPDQTIKNCFERLE